MSNLKIYNRQTGQWEEIKVNTRLKTIKRSVTLSAHVNQVDIGITEYNPEDDVLLVYKNGNYIENNRDYELIPGALKIKTIDNSNWQAGTIFDFIVLKNVQREIPSADGSLIQSNSITDDKLAEGIKISPALVDKKGTVYSSLKLRFDSIDDKFDLLFNRNTAFSVKEYGAKGDGITDDTNAFQECANAISENGGGIFEIPYSENGYVIQGTVNMPSNVIVNGNGSLIIASTSDNAQTPFYWKDKTNIVVYDLRINGRKDLKYGHVSIAGGSNGLTFRGNCKFIRIQNCHFFNTMEHGIHFYGEVLRNPDRVSRSEDIVITDCTFENNGNPDWIVGPRGAGIMLFYGARNVKIHNNNFKDFSRIGIYIDSAHSNKDTLTSTYPGLSVENGDYVGFDVIVSNNYFKIENYHGKFTGADAGVAIAAHGQQRVKITDNMIEIPIGVYRGISVDDGQDRSPTHSIEIKNNRITATEECVELRDCSYITVTDNVLEHVSGTQPTIGVYYSPSNSESLNKVHEIVIKNNIIKNGADRGIFLVNGSGNTADFYNIFIENNRIILTNKEDPEAQGIATEYIDNLNIIGNFVKGGKYGIYTPRLATNVNIENNKVSDADQGIVSTGVVRCAFNVVKNCTTYDIRLTNPNSIAIFNDANVSFVDDLSSYIQMNGLNLKIGYQTSNTHKNALQLGNYFLWVDSNGKLRIKNGAPKSNTDGTIVGTQS
jgi:hypothetical protein